MATYLMPGLSWASKFFRLGGTFFLLAALFGSSRAAPPAMAGAWQARVDPWVLASASESEAEFFVFLKEQADLSRADLLKTKLEKGQYVFQQLTETAARSQSALLAELEKQGVEHKPYWIANMIWARGDAALVQALATRQEVAHLYANPSVHLDEPALSPPVDESLAPEAIEWNILQVNAEELWALGYTGQGAVIGGQDTGYDWDHPALKNQYRGWDGSTVDHNYNWHDAIHSGGGDCGPNSPEPCDDDNHGTHTMGTMVGDDVAVGGVNQIGMAPGARWIGCRNMDEGDGTPASYAECYQWFLAPTDLNGLNPRPDLAPDVINNSWSCPASEGCSDPNVLLAVVNNVRSAGILTVHAAGNSGRFGCSTVDEPAAIYAASFAVGATNILNNIASFSSRGPVTVDGSNRLKPQVSAPGVGIRSSVNGGGYQSGWSGTSMAAPHVAGLAALLISADPALGGNVNALESLIESGALPRTTSQNCGDVPGTQVPNNTYGWGRVDALASYQNLVNVFERSFLPVIPVGP